MAILYVYESDRADLDVYDRINSQITQVPDGAICHVACERDGGGLFVVEVWESEEKQDRWNAFIQEKIVANGGPPRPEPRKLPVHNMRFGNTETAGTRR
ncbi:MAG TPA: hypothetical protein VFL13_12060 [Candidatus Baltobacteraceae bacterium]|nr:hypothetical protein [Candidatus Baltobacteraceae bacterium]